MRRRTWTFLRQADILISFQVGLPSMLGLNPFQCPTPLNLRDEDFDERCIALPQALPDSEATQISFLIAKSKLAFGFARAVENINSANSMQCRRVLEIDRELRDIYDSVPDHYKLGRLSSEDSLILTSSRFVLSSIHHKSLCVVHSRFLEKGKTDPRYLYSRKVCLTSAMSLLRFQAIQNQKIPVDGHMRSLTNYQTSLAIHDYLLAATIISAELCSSLRRSNSAHQLSPGVPSQTEMIKALQLSAQIFSQMGDQSMEAYKAGDVLGMLTRKLRANDDKNSLQSLKKSHPYRPPGPYETNNGGINSSSTSLHRQVTPRASSGGAFSARYIADANVGATNSQEVPQGSMHGIAQALRSQYNHEEELARGGAWTNSLDFYSLDPEPAENTSCPSPPLFPQYVSRNEESASWELPEYTDFSTVS